MVQIQGGDLDRRIVLLRATLTPNAYNEQVEVFSAIGTVSAKKVDASGYESYRSGEVNATNLVRFTIRFNAVTASVTAKDRIAYGNRFYNITTTREMMDRRKRYIEIDAVVRGD